MVRIIINNHRSRVVGDAKIVHKLHTTLKIKSPGYFWSTAWRNRTWDGFIKYVTESGTFMTGLLHQVIETLESWKAEFEIEDNRESFKPLNNLTELGDLEFRGYQKSAIEAFLNNKVKGIPFRRGILNEATNAGKNLIAAGIFASFAEKRRAIFLIDSTTIYTQAVKELGELLPGEVGEFSSKKQDMGKRFTVCMSQSLGSHLKKNPRVKRWLESIHMVFVDECDTVATRKETKAIAAACHNAPCRVGLSGTALNSKDKTRNQEVLSFFGPIIHRTTNKELVDQGYSSKPTITFHKGNRTNIFKGKYQMEYRKGIITNGTRNKKIWNIAKKKVKKGPVVILIKLHEHIDYLDKRLPKEMKERYKIERVHHETSNKTKLLQDFNKGKIDILIASMIIRRGMNLKIMRTLINAAGGDSHANILQLLGRGLRKEAGVKEEIDIEEFYDQGVYLRRHSKHRIRYYKQEGFPVKELY